MDDLEQPIVRRRSVFLDMSPERKARVLKQLDRTCTKKIPVPIHIYCQKKYDGVRIRSGGIDPKPLRALPLKEMPRPINKKTKKRTSASKKESVRKPVPAQTGKGNKKPDEYHGSSQILMKFILKR